MRTLGLILVLAFCYGAAGAVVSAPVGTALGLVFEGPREGCAKGALFGTVLGVSAAALMSDPVGSRDPQTRTKGRPPDPDPGKKSGAE